MYSILRKKVCAALIGLLVAASPILSLASQPADHAQTVSPTPPDTIVVGSIDELLELIVQRNPELAATVLNARALGADADAVQRLPDPMAGFTVLPLPIHTARGEQRFQLRAEQMIPWPGKVALDRSLAELQADASVSSSEEKSLDLRITALDRIVDLARIDALENTILDYARRLEDLERVAGIRYEVGQGPQSAIVKSQVERSDLELRLARLRSARSTAMADLGAAAGAPIRLTFDPAAVQARAIPAAVAMPVDSLLSIAVLERPAFERVRILQRRSSAAVDRAELSLRPDFGVGMTWFGITDSDIPPASDGRDALGVGFSIRIPLHRDEKRASVESARLSVMRTDETMQGLVVSTRAAIERQVAEIRSASEQLELFRTSLIPGAELSAATSLQAYESGGATYLDLLDAERTLFRLNLTRIETEVRLQHLALRLERLLGSTPIPR